MKVYGDHLKVVKWDGQGHHPQGDVLLYRIPDAVKINADSPVIPAVEGRLVLAEGEVTGHHHQIYLLDSIPRRASDFGGDLAVMEAPTKTRKAPKHEPEVTGRATHGQARLLRDPNVVEALKPYGLMDGDLYIAVLEVKDAPVVLYHDEHDGIEIPCGKGGAPAYYYVGGQVESIAAELRRVAD